MKLNLKIADFLDKINPRLTLYYINKCSIVTFEQYLIEIGIRSKEFTFKNDELFQNTKHFKKCWKSNLSPYKALLFLNDEINNKQL
jgi:hypothetical protein